MSSSDPKQAPGGGSLPQNLVDRLSTSLSAEDKSEIAAMIGRAFAGAQLSDDDSLLAHEVVRQLAGDMERRVRESLAASIRKAPDLPKDVALKLANDVASVAAPILTDSVALSEQDLVAIVGDGDVAKQLAVAAREFVPDAVAGALVEHGSEEVVVTVVANPGAELRESTLTRALDRFGDSPRLHAPMVARDALPIAVSERLVALVSEKLRDDLVRRHELPADVAADLVLEGRERATLALVSDDAEGDRVEDLVAELARNGRLSNSIILRAACTGDMAFLEASLANRAEIPAKNARDLVHDAGKRGLAALLTKSGFDDQESLAIRTAVEVVRETEMTDSPHAREHFAEVVIERVLTAFDVDEDGVPEEDAEYLIRKLTAYTDSRTEGQSPDS